MANPYEPLPDMCRPATSDVTPAAAGTCDRRHLPDDLMRNGAYRPQTAAGSLPLEKSGKPDWINQTSSPAAGVGSQQPAHVMPPALSFIEHRWSHAEQGFRYALLQLFIVHGVIAAAVIPAVLVISGVGLIFPDWPAAGAAGGLSSLLGVLVWRRGRRQRP
ncbi:hypothetical protein Dvina_52315 [Dactylosporangium vinaceum]|uniref:Uncharacterized protein n=1 Tax=Dactylosporangium vinaceum TaxID=53362 RepID=A0ABV5MQM9_9ACTN|nr:hypothetical protein [Dactylosporangium vinaceum]UAB96415.1 hypothetical protein Dvina_52315 [Dactylosporangium vinaceum]